MRSSMLCSIFLCVGLFMLAGCGGSDTGNSLAKEVKALGEKYSAAVKKEKEPKKMAAHLEKFEAEKKAIKERFDKLSDAEKEKFLEAVGKD